MADYICLTWQDGSNPESVYIPESALRAAAMKLGYVPAPRWNPVAQLPDAWRDGRPVVVSQLWDDGRRSTHCVTYSGGSWGDGEYSYEPDLFLDLAIPEVPRG